MYSKLQRQFFEIPLKLTKVEFHFYSNLRVVLILCAVLCEFIMDFAGQKHVINNIGIHIDYSGMHKFLELSQNPRSARHIEFFCARLTLFHVNT